MAINLLAPILLAVGLLYLGKFRAALIDSRIEGLFVQGELVAGALGESAIVARETGPGLEPEVARQIIRRLVAASGTRARLFDEGGELIADSRFLALAGRDVIQRNLPPPQLPSRFPQELQLVYDEIASWFPTGLGLPPYSERPVQRVDDYPEAAEALAGTPASNLRDAGDGTMIITIAMPVQGLRKVVGSLLLSVDSTEVDERVRDERLDILVRFALVLVVTVALSFYLAGTIARPIRRLAEAADMVRTVRGRRVSIPDFRARRDEIGELSGTLREMTGALYRRLDAIEAFAADVAHEIKNPLTSLRSAVETMQRANDPEKQRRLMAIIQDDVGRLDRLISDISAASRLDAALSREETEPVDLAKLLQTVVAACRETAPPGTPAVKLAIADPAELVVAGLADRLGEVVHNLLDNAISFSSPGGEIRVGAGRDASGVWFAVEDDGPGIPDGKLDAIFQRFYTERPAGEAFGTHSGLGLSISRQIVETLGGTIEAANRRDAAGNIVGARFTVRLPG